MQRILLGTAILLAGCASAQEQPRNLVLFIGDGYGPAYAELARAVSGEPLAMDAVLVGGAQTASADSRVAESAAAATAYACGIATNNGRVGTDAAGRPCRTLFEAAREHGARVGLVTTTRVTHATPAAFESHVADRDQEVEIATQIAAAGLDVLFGGGARFFRPADVGGSREDGRDLLQELSEDGYIVVTDPTCFTTIDALPAAAIVTNDHMAYEIDRDETEEPSLADMTARALDLLFAHREPFVLMVEGGRIDHAGHGNDPAGAVHDVLAYDAAFELALDRARADGRTLVVGVSDHETGGLSLGRDDVYDWHHAALGRVTQSAGRLAARIRAGEAAALVLRDGAGLADLTPAELAAIDSAGDDLSGAIADLLSRRAGVAWTTEGHTGSDVPVYAWGPGAERFHGSRPAAEVGRLLREVMGW
jgi:alkaline phosphatase